MPPRPSFALLALACAALGLAAPATVRAVDVLVLANGDRLTGKVTKHADGKIYFHSDVLGDLVAPETAVTIVEKQASPTPVESMVGLPPPKPVPTVAPAPGAAPVPVAEKSALASPTASTLPPPQVAQTAAPATPVTPPVAPIAIAPPPETAPAIPHPIVKVLDQRGKVPIALTPPVLPWTGKIEFGYDNIVSNDIRTVALTFRAEMERTIRDNNYLLKGRFLYGSSGSVPTTDEEDGDFRWRHNLSDRLFTQSDTTYDSDKIKLIHYQVDENVGLGYKIFKSVRQTVDVGAGVTGEELDSTGVEKGFTYLGNVFQDYAYKINGRYTFLEDVSADYSPETRGLSGNVPDTVVLASGSQRDYDYKFHATLQGKINERLSLNLHFEYEYDNAVANPTARVEQRITTTLGYGF